MAVRQASDYGNRFALEASPHVRPGLWLSLSVAGIFACGIAVPRLMPALLPAVLVCFALYGSPAARAVPRLHIAGRRLMAAFAGVAAIGIANSPDVLYAVWLTLSFAAIALTAHWLITAVGQLSSSVLVEVRRAAVAGLAAGAAYLVIEQSAGRPIIGSFYEAFPVFAGKSEYTFILDERGHDLVRRHILNRGTGVLMLLLWPLLLLLAFEIKRGTAGRWTLPAALALASSAIMLSAHEASKVALAVSLCAFALAFVARRMAVVLLLVGWIVANAAVVPAVRIAYDNGWQLDTGLTGSARARITIWNFTATRISSAWVSGHGIDSVRYDDSRLKPAYVAGEEGQHRTGRHSHNVFLQIWYEFGILGCLLWTCAGLYVLAGVRRFKAPAQPFVIAGAAAGIVILSCSWGLWQHWYASAVALSTVLFAIAAASGLAVPRGKPAAGG